MPFDNTSRVFFMRNDGGHQFFDVRQNDGLNSASTVKISKRLKNMNAHAHNLLKLGSNA